MDSNSNPTYRGVLQILLLVSLYALVAAKDAFSAVNLENGVLIGKECDSGFDAYEYLGIPFALSPVGELRFRPPVYYNTSYPEEGFNATKFPPGCGSPCDNTASGDNRKTIGEDCLFLNIYAPKNNSGRMPVRVYIHGGSNRCCRASDAMLTGCSAAGNSETIVVVIQYRLGPFGYLAHPQTFIESNTTGNWGLLDQQMALIWVQKNIASFGGDPNQVVLHGGSSGASSVTLHNIMPSSAGLFHAAITQSATCYDPLTLENSYVVRAEFSAILGCASEDSVEELACLRAANVTSMVNATADFTMDSNCYSRSHFGFNPTVDGTIIPMKVIDAVSSGSFNKVPLMVGVNSDEGSFFISLLFDNAPNVTVEEVYEFLEVVYPGVNPEKVLSIYPEENYEDRDFPMYRRVLDLLGDIFVKCPGYELLNAHSAQGVATFSYYFSHTPTCPVIDIFKGASHGTELAFVFRNLVDITPPGGGCDLTTAERDFSQSIQVPWSSMGSKGYPMFANGTVWPQWTQNSTLSTQLDTDLTFVDVGFADTCELLAIIAEEAETAWNSMDKEGLDLREYLKLKQNGRARKFLS